MTSSTVPSLDGVALRVDDVGPRDRRPLLFVHGLAQDRHAFAPLVARLATDFRCVTFDLRGHGASDAPEPTAPYTEGARLADDVHAIVEALGLDAPVVLPWSYGGAVLGEYLRRYGAGRIAGAFLFAAAVRLGRSAGAFFGPVMMGNARGLVSTERSFFEASARAFAEGCAKVASPAFVEDRIAATLRARPPVLRALLSRDEDYVPSYADATFPIAAVQGEDDAVVLPSLVAHLRERAPRVAVTSLPGVGHASFAEATDEVERVLRAFVAAL